MNELVLKIESCTTCYNPDISFASHIKRAANTDSLFDSGFYKTFVKSGSIFISSADSVMTSTEIQMKTFVILLYRRLESKTELQIVEFKEIAELSIETDNSLMQKLSIPVNIFKEPLFTSPSASASASASDQPLFNYNYFFKPKG